MQTQEIAVNDINAQVYALLEDLSSFGMKSSPRGQQVVEANIATLDIDPKRCLINFKDRPFNYKYFAGEIAWYLEKTANINFISNFSKFWKNVENPETGKINSNYGHILLDSHPSTRHTKKGVNELEWVYNSLVKDKDSRQAVAFLNCPYYQYEGNKDFVCTMYLNFWIRHDRLDMKVQMRSNDIFFGLSYDAPWFSLIHQSMYLNLKKVYPKLQLGMYYHTADNIHYYERHFELVEQILNAPLESSPTMELKSPIFWFDEEGTLGINPLFIEYRHEVEHIVKNGEMNSVDWKSLLQKYVNITEESE